MSMTIVVATTLCSSCDMYVPDSTVMSFSEIRGADHAFHRMMFSREDLSERFIDEQGLFKEAQPLNPGFV